MDQMIVIIYIDEREHTLDVPGARVFIFIKVIPAKPLP